MTCYLDTKCDFHNTPDCDVAMIKWLYSEHKVQPKLTKKERQFCELVETGYISRDKDGALFWFDSKPIKGMYIWSNAGKSWSLSNFINKKFNFHFITWDDKEPWSVEDLLKLEVEE